MVGRRTHGGLREFRGTVQAPAQGRCHPSAAGLASAEERIARLIDSGAKASIVAFDPIHERGIRQEQGDEEFKKVFRMAGLGGAGIEYRPL